MFRGFKMEYNELVTIISTVGFPIVACGALFYMINTTMKELKDAINSLDKTIQSLISQNENEGGDHVKN